MTRTYDRRRLLTMIGTAGITVAVAGCSSNGSNGQTDGTDGDGNDITPTTGSDDESDGFVESSTVDMTDELTFDPKQIRVSAGTTVTWVNVGSIGHTVTAYQDQIPDGAEYFASGGFDSEQAAVDGYPEEGNVPSEGSFEHTFETEGTYEYYCIPHELNGMVATVEVV
ncbi:MAG: plastocyanin/azurin family copper-binding protein [Halobacteriales archaeon]|nr:plastocyanin/azurin family copper-binding protein [Halobacteriales archaeon]